MAITTPKGEQIQFVSAKTGTHNLDTYLEAAEIGNRQLHDLLDDMFDSSTGVFKADNFQFRFDTSTDKLQVRVGQFANSTASWTDVTTFFKVTGTFSTSTSYNNFDLVTLSTKDVYIVHGLTTATAYSSESNFISSANTSKIVDVSEAKDWASKTDGQVSSTDYSSKAWAIGGTGVTDTASKGAAKEWATKTSGTVDGSDYSAKHWATTGNVAAVSGSIGNINNVSSYLIPITNVADNITSVNTVSGSITNVNTVAGSISNVNTVAGLDAKMTSVVALESNINTLGAIGSDITTVSGVSAGVVTCAILSQQIANVSNNSTNVNLVGNAISNVNTVGGAISNVNTVATNISSVNDFADKYRIGSSDPSSNNDEGDLFYNTSTNALKVYDGSAWTSGVAVGSGFLPISGGQLTGNITMSGSQTVDGRDLSADGTKLDTVATNANAYAHPTGNGNNHIPSNGSSGQILGYASAGTAQWQAAPSSDLVDDTSPQLGGDLATNGHDVVMGNNDLIKLGTFSGQPAAAFIFSNGNTLSLNSWGETRITGSNMTFAKAGGGEEYARFVADGATSLYHNNIKKFETTATGIDVTGNVVVSGTVDGRDIATNIPSSLGSAGQVLTVNSGASAAEWAAAGGGADLYTANESSPDAQPSATGTNAVAIGDSSEASGTRSTALGKGIAAALESAAIGPAYAGGASSFAAGISTNGNSYGATSGGAIALGQNAKASYFRATAIGEYAIASGNRATAIGRSATSAGTYAFAGGGQSRADGDYSVALGQSFANGENSFAAGIGVTNGSKGAMNINSVAIGQNANAGWNNSLAIGISATTGATNQIALGGTSNQVKISGTYTLPTSDGSANQVLTTNGSGVVTFADAGGGADLYAANESSPAAQPSATGTNAVAIGDSAVAAGTKALSGPISYASGFNSFAAANNENSGTYGAKGDYSVALGFRANATLAYSTAIGPQASALGNYATAIGRQSYSVTDSVALAKSYASGADAFAAAIANNTSSYGATGSNSIAMGHQAKATGTKAVSIGDIVTASGTRSTAQGYFSTASATYSHVTGRLNTSSGNYSTVWGGFQSTASGSNSSIINGFSSVAGQNYSTAIGPYSTTRAQYSFALGGHSFGAQGAGQSSTFNLISDTTDATSEAMTTNNSSAGTINQVILPNNSAYAFHGTIVARQQASAGTACAAWKVEGLIRREGSAGTTVLVNSATTVLDNTPSWGMALSADTTNGGLKIQVTGAASTSIRWVATINTSEVTFA